VVDAAKKYYTTRPGDSLAKIAEEVMGDDSRAAVQKLYTANKSKIRDPNKLTVGMKLEIPT
jgi:nucleoid-associated protein YgaU